VQNKWKDLRDYFRLEHVKIPLSQSGDASNNVTPARPYYRQLLFLKDQIKNMMSQGDLQATQPDNETTNNCSGSFVGDEPLRPETQEEVSVSPASTSTFTGEEVQSEPRVSVPQRARKQPKIALLNVEQRKRD
jgi:hypothetical protein